MLLSSPQRRAIKYELKQRTRFLKLQPRQPRVKFRYIPVSQVAQKIRLDVACREELLVVSFAIFPCAKNSSSSLEFSFGLLLSQSLHESQHQHATGMIYLDANNGNTLEYPTMTSFTGSSASFQLDPRFQDLVRRVGFR
jgi:hypothetical protein